MPSLNLSSATERIGMLLVNNILSKATFGPGTPLGSVGKLKVGGGKGKGVGEIVFHFFILRPEDDHPCVSEPS